MESLNHPLPGLRDRTSLLNGRLGELIAALSQKPLPLRFQSSLLLNEDFPILAALFTNSALSVLGNGYPSDLGKV